MKNIITKKGAANHNNTTPLAIRVHSRILITPLLDNTPVKTYRKKIIRNS